MAGGVYALSLEPLDTCKHLSNLSEPKPPRPEARAAVEEKERRRESEREREQASTAVSSLNAPLIRNNRAGGSRGPSLDPNSL